MMHPPIPSELFHLLKLQNLLRFPFGLILFPIILFFLAPFVFERRTYGILPSLNRRNFAPYGVGYGGEDDILSSFAFPTTLDIFA